MAASSEDGAGLDPKWLVAGVALAGFGLILNYDLRLGIAAGALLGAVLAAWLYLALRYGSLSGAPSGRQALALRVRAQAQARSDAAARMRGRSGAQQGADPAERP